MKGQSQLSLVARTVVRSGKKQNEKYAYVFLDSTERLSTGLFIGREAYTYWTEDDFSDAKLGDVFTVEFETVGDAIVLRSAVPVTKPAK